MKKIKILISVLVGFGLALLVGLWSQSLFVVSESIHFSVNFPTNPELGAPTLAPSELGGSWSRIPSGDWTGYPAGGLLAYGMEGNILVDVGKEGFLKRTFQPMAVNLSSHWLRNVGIQPYRILLNMNLCEIQLKWQTHETDWDPVSRVSTREIEPGKTFNMDWYFDIPYNKLNQKSICNGSLEVRDAQSNTVLTVLPITLINSLAD
jgi:hypothetical protein